MEHVVTITRQGQLTIPQAIRRHFRIHDSTKVVIRTLGNTIVVEPKGDFWSLSGGLKSSVRLSDAELASARDAFTKKWAKRI
ncbi:MAG: AbrB/MazE/SpoVT family DNA-binding domain-containing protein [Candidatus Kerfeldbacteria bacterium]|nr:AbrB/MazE/SpoVT family DNA-binding domain-containing protein [Candidatus Kerfeldbacteria bacterium]